MTYAALPLVRPRPLSYDLGNSPRKPVAYNTPSTAKPAYLGSYVDPIFGTRITRISGDFQAAIPVVGGTWSNRTRATYDITAAWNANDTQIWVIASALENSGGGPPNGNLFLDGNTYAPLYARSIPYPTYDDVRWHPTNPRYMQFWGTPDGSNINFGLFDPSIPAFIEQVRFAGYQGATVGGKGQSTPDGNKLAVKATRQSDSKTVVFSVDLLNKTKTPDIDPAVVGIPVSSTSISPKGDLIVVYGRDDTVAVYDLAGNVVQRWMEGLTTPFPTHGSLTLDAVGNQVYAGLSKANIGPVKSGTIMMRNLRTGVYSELCNGGYSALVSARNDFGVPGWAVVNSAGVPGTNGVPNPSYLPFNDEIFAVKLDGSRIAVRLGHTHDNNTDYDCQGFIAPSHAGTRVLFSSNWNAALPNGTNSSITTSGTTATVTTSSPHGLGINGATPPVTISGATPAGYNLTKVTATVTSTTQFTYTVGSTLADASPAGSFTAVHSRPIQLYVIDLRNNIAGRPA